MDIDPLSRTLAKRGRSLKLFLVDGTASGVTTAELGLSSVRAVVASRTALPDLIKREEASRTGVYLLMGPDPAAPSQQLVYVGEGDQVKKRLVEHDADDKKEFFTRAVLIVAKDDTLTKAHGRYLESRLIAAIKNSGRAKLVNNTEPLPKGLPESDIADMDRMIEEIEVLLPVLGFDVLAPPVQAINLRAAPINVSRGEISENAPTFVVTFNDRENGVTAKARAIEQSGEFVVFATSTALKRETPGLSQGVSDRRKMLQDTGVLVPDSNPALLVFVQNASFGSPSGASQTIAGRSDNGKTSWIHEGDGRQYGIWRTAQIRATASEGSSDSEE